jgi:hypothetical protein
VCGSDFAGDLYLLLGSFSGTSPGLAIGGVTLPLVALDPYFNLTLTQPNLPPFSQTFGTLDGNGGASASLTIPPGLATPLIGITINHAFLALDPIDLSVTLASNAQALDVLP